MNGMLLQYAASATRAMPGRFCLGILHLWELQEAGGTVLHVVLVQVAHRHKEVQRALEGQLVVGAPARHPAGSSWVGAPVGTRKAPHGRIHRSRGGGKLALSGMLRAKASREDQSSGRLPACQVTPNPSLT